MRPLAQKLQSQPDAERTAGIVTVGAFLVAFALANSPLRESFDVLHHLPLSV